jgi:amino acid transporter
MTAILLGIGLGIVISALIMLLVPLVIGQLERLFAVYGGYVDWVERKRL